MKVSHANHDYLKIKKDKNPQNQGVSPDCAMFAIANAVALLNNTDPQSVQFVTSEIRNHLRQSLLEGIVNNFRISKSQALKQLCSLLNY